MDTHRPEVVDKDVEHTEDNDQDDSTPFCFESNNNHDRGNETNAADNDSPQAPFARKDESNEQKDEQDPASKLNVHLAVLLLELWKTSGHELLAHPGVRKDHEETTDDTEIADNEGYVN